MTARPPKLLSGGNPQIAKGDGDAPVQAYIAGGPPAGLGRAGRQASAVRISAIAWA